MAIWLAEAEYLDGKRIEKRVPYTENGNYHREEETQYGLECWLVEQHNDCVWYSVSVVDE